MAANTVAQQVFEAEIDAMVQVRGTIQKKIVESG